VNGVARTAIHEAGHAAVFLYYNMPINFVRIGYFWLSKPEDPSFLQDRGGVVAAKGQLLNADLSDIVSVSGTVAEILWLKRSVSMMNLIRSTRNQSDLSYIVDGRSEKIKETLQQSETILRAHWASVIRLACRFNSPYQYIFEAEIQRIWKNHK
jgi:hypothetical protein